MITQTMANLCFISLTLSFLLIFHGCAARRQEQQQSQCQLQRINAVKPNQRIQSEGGVTENWDQNDEQFECTGVAATRHTIRSRGLLLPQFSNAPKLTYVVQGRGIQGQVIPGCPETYESQQSQRGESQQSHHEESQQGSRDRHQKIKDLRAGDIVATPAGVAHWFYNDGQKPLVMVTVHHMSNDENQLDETRREFFLAGNPQQQQQQGRQQEGQQSKGSQQEQQSQNSINIFQAFDDQILAQAFGVRRETVRKLKSENDNRGNIVLVENGLQLVRPPRSEQEEKQQRQGQQGQQEQEEQESSSNGIEETFCTVRFRENIGEAIRADVYNPQGGRLRSINSGTLPILKVLQMSAERGVLYRNALMAPHWNMNANSVVYVTGGSARIQISGNNQRPVFDGQVKEGQLVVVPQNFVVMCQAGNNGFEWISFKTNDNAMSTPVAGKTSALAAMPLDVLVNAFQGLSRDEAMNLKNNRRQESIILAPSSSSQQGSA